MKKIILIRHAKSEPQQAGSGDFERALTTKGENQTHYLADQLSQKGLAIDRILCSPAKRTLQTASILCDALRLDPAIIQTVPSLYLAGPETYAPLIETIENRFQSVAIVSHNPGISEFANDLCEGVVIDQMPTASAFAISTPETEWPRFSESVNKFLFFSRPTLL